MSLKKNILANYIGQIYLSLIGILMLPVYIKYMGAEAFGLVGFFSILQVCFNLLDLGLSPTISRETARFHAGVMRADDYRRLFRALSLIFSGIALFGGGLLFVLAEPIARDWLKIGKLPLEEVRVVVEIMAASVALRWMEGLYRGVIIGSERLIWLSGYISSFATLRYVVVLPVMWYFGFTPLVFFLHQLVVTTLETLGLWLKVTHMLPALPNTSQPIGWSLAPIKPLLKFSMIIAFTSAVWVLVTQSDKFVLSGILTLKDYGYFTLAVLVANGVTIISGPISNAIMPRMASLYAVDRHDEMIRVYRSSTQFVSIIAGAISITLACCARPLLFAWTGDARLAEEAAPILGLYAAGNGFLAICAFPYYLQYAKGNLRYHLIGNIGMVLVLIPLIVLAAMRWGGVGAGYVWMGTNLLYLLTWTAYVHHKLEPGLHRNWLLGDVLRVIGAGIIIAIVVSLADIHFATRAASIIYTLAVGLVVILCAILCSKPARLLLLSKLASRFS